ncbi:MAG: hypothetical protein HY461_01210 [Parcubacteria group bacterium]|nr:hypothetical protein [Parcubacteria group bacterium]
MSAWFIKKSTPAEKPPKPEAHLSQPKTAESPVNQAVAEALVNLRYEQGRMRAAEQALAQIPKGSERERLEADKGKILTTLAGCANVLTDLCKASGINPTRFPELQQASDRLQPPTPAAPEAASPVEAVPEPEAPAPAAEEPAEEPPAVEVPAEAVPAAEAPEPAAEVPAEPAEAPAPAEEPPAAVETPEAPHLPEPTPAADAAPAPETPAPAAKAKPERPPKHDDAEFFLAFDKLYNDFYRIARSSRASLTQLDTISAQFDAYKETPNKIPADLKTSLINAMLDVYQEINGRPFSLKQPGGREKIMGRNAIFNMVDHLELQAKLEDILAKRRADEWRANARAAEAKAAAKRAKAEGDQSAAAARAERPTREPKAPRPAPEPKPAPEPTPGEPPVKPESGAETEKSIDPEIRKAFNDLCEAADIGGADDPRVSPLYELAKTPGDPAEWDARIKDDIMEKATELLAASGLDDLPEKLAWNQKIVDLAFVEPRGPGFRSAGIDQPTIQHLVDNAGKLKKRLTSQERAADRALSSLRRRFEIDAPSIPKPTLAEIQAFQNQLRPTS